MKVALELHDFSVLNNRLDLLMKLKEHYPNFKVSLFTIPFDVKHEVGIQQIYREAAVKKLKECLDWIQLIPHGLTHMAKEFEKCDYDLFRYKVMPSIKEAFDRDGLPFEKGFCAPYWLWNKDVVKALDDEGWWGAINRGTREIGHIVMKDTSDTLSTKRFYEYSHSLEEPYYKANMDVLKLHGHLDSISENDLERCYLNLFKLPSDVTWHYVSEFVETK